MAHRFRAHIAVVLVPFLAVPSVGAQAPPRRSAPAPPAPAGRPAIAHDAVGCVVAERHPELQACFTPAESVARAQVQFRADEKGPWYYVDMKGDGACRTAVLPKPRKDIARFHYFIETIDRAFTSELSPASAPGDSYTPRVVTSAAACEAGVAVARNSPSASVVMGVSRDAAGNVVQAAAAQGGPVPASINGFSTEGVSMANPGAATGEAGSDGASKAARSGNRTLLIAGGAAVAVGAVALAAGGGGGSDSGGAGSPGGTTAPGGGGGGTTTPATSLSGRWSGAADRGDGIVSMVSGQGITCSSRQDLTLDLVQTGQSLTGSGTSVGRGIDCSVPLPPNLAEVFLGQMGFGTLSGTASGGTLTFQAGMFTFNGTYTATRIEATANMPLEGFTFALTVRVNKQ